MSDPEQVETPSYQPWRLPNLLQAQRVVPAKEAQDPAEVAFEKAKQSGHAQGYAEGLEAAKQEYAAQQAALIALMNEFQSFQNVIAAALETQAQAVIEALVSHIVCYEVALEPEHIQKLLTLSLEKIKDHEGTVTVGLNPEDYAALKNAPEFSNIKDIQFTENPDLARGGCELLTNSSTLNIDLKERLQEALQSLFGQSGSA